MCHDKDVLPAVIIRIKPAEEGQENRFLVNLKVFSDTHAADELVKFDVPYDAGKNIETWHFMGQQ